MATNKPENQNLELDNNSNSEFKLKQPESLDFEYAAVTRYFIIDGEGIYISKDHEPEVENLGLLSTEELTEKLVEVQEYNTQIKQKALEENSISYPFKIVILLSAVTELLNQ